MRSQEIQQALEKLKAASADIEAAATTLLEASSVVHTISAATSLRFSWPTPEMTG